MAAYPIRFIVTLLFFGLLFFVQVSQAEPAGDDVPGLTETAGEFGIDSIQAKIAELKTDSSLDESARTRMTDLYESALKQIKAANGYKKQADFYREAALQAPAEIEDINKQLNETIDASRRSASIDYQKIQPHQLDNQIFETRLRLDSLKANLEQLGRNLKQQQSRPEQIRLDQRSIQDKLQDLEQQTRSQLFAGNGTYKAQLTALRATEKALRANLDALQMELSSHLPRLQLLRARYDLAIAKVATENARLENLEKYLAANRESEAARYSQELTEALEAASNKHPMIRELIQENFEFGREFGRISEEIALATNRRDEIKEEAKRIENDSENSEKKIALAGLSPTLAAILREQRRLLPSAAKIDRVVAKLVAKTGEVTLRLFEIEEKLRSLVDIGRRVDDKLASSAEDDELSKHQLMRVRVESNLLLEEQRSLLMKLSETYTKYLNILSEIDYSRQRLVEVATRYAAFLDENLLWVKSSRPIDHQFLGNLGNAARWFLSPQQWSETGNRLVRAMNARKPLVLILCALILAPLGARRVIKERLAEISELVAVARNDRFRYTLDAIGLTVLLVTPGVAVVYGVGWLLDSNANSPEFTRAVGRGLCAASIPLYLLETFYRIFSPGGIAELHLRWRRRAVTALGSQLRWLRFVVVPGIFFITMTGSQSEAEYSDSLGRLAVIAVMIAMSVALGKVLHPTRGGLKYFLADRSSSAFARARFIWYSVVLVIPLIIAGFAAAGYLASAIELQEKMSATIRVVFIAIIVHELALRGLRLFNRELALKKLREKRMLEKTAKPVGEAGETLPSIDHDQIDISTINSQTMRLVLTGIVFGTVVGLWVLWQDVLPALAILNEWVLWQTPVIVDGVETIKSVSLSNLLVALLYILIAVTATRNLPGVMEVLIMNRFSIDAGSRYAINQLIGYALIAAAVVLVAAELGGQWSELQWLVAALGVGLGFGLQEIFANFVSGIILLFERPIRIGDTVTVGDVSGTVSRIQIRATTITDWERKDLVVPNRTFITDRLINWTRTDNITRILIPIGIAYGSDTVLAHQIILEIVRSHPLVLKEPEPSAFFVGFGENSLNFEIRAFVKEISDRLPLTHDLHMQLNQQLKQQGIEMPVPQRDIHLRLVAAEFLKAQVTASPSPDVNGPAMN